MTAAAMEPRTAWSRSENVAEVPSPDEGRYAVLPLGARQEVPLILAGTGAAVWEEVAAGGTTEALVDRLAARYDVAPEAIFGQVCAFLDELAGRDLISGVSHND
ncbi:hypothetical protein BJH93_11555 [Kocuria polaris]|nr:hypothetical protein [Kocuria polaris]